MTKKWAFSITSLLVLGGVMFYVAACSSEDEKKKDEVASTGSCIYDAVPLGDSGLTTKLCIDSTTVTNAESKCTTADPELGGLAGTWSYDSCILAQTETATATCSFTDTDTGGYITISTYDPNYNFILDPAQNEEDGGPCGAEGVYVEFISPPTVTKSIVVSSGGTKVQCVEITATELTMTQLETQFASVGTFSDAVCDSTGFVNECVNSTDPEGGFTSDTYYFVAGSASDETKCTEKGGVWL